MKTSIDEPPGSPGYRFWAELEGDSALSSLRFSILGSMPRKTERIAKRVSWFSLAVLWRGSGTFRAAGESGPQPVQAPGFFMQAPGMVHDYGPVEGGLWSEFYWTVEGERVREWLRGGWWHREPRFEPITDGEAAELHRLFTASSQALEVRDRGTLDGAKLDFERWLARRVRPVRAPESALSRTVESWRRDPRRAWSMREAAAEAKLSYTRFRALFLQELGTSPYDHLLRLRIELAARWLSSTDEPIKAIAAQCGFGSAESFVRAFRRCHGLSPGRWRAREGRQARSRSHR